ncbi:hypothetical protein VTO42DRAFT_8761 [Malbranchea cinnamomea]
MGRLNLTAIRVRQTALAQKACGKTDKIPCWADVVADIPPATILVRNKPVEHPVVRQRVKTVPGSSKPQVVYETVPIPGPKSKKASRMFKPMQIRYEEDELRKEFFRDHPWELARPRVVLENDGKDYLRYDWNKLQQPGKRLDGESVVQRQLHLLHTVPDITKQEAYDVARKEFYQLRHQEDIERRVAQEEAKAAGAYFGPSLLEIGMELENQEYERWKEWSERESALSSQRTASLIGAEPEETAPKAPVGEPEEPIPISGLS